MRTFIEFRDANDGVVLVRPEKVEAIRAAKLGGFDCAEIHLSSGQSIIVDAEPADVRWMISEAGKIDVY
jgi:hypothetical protein